MSILEERMKARKNTGEQYNKVSKLGIPGFEASGSQSPSRRFGLTRGAQQDAMLRTQEKEFLKPGSSYSRDTFPMPFANFNVETKYLQSPNAKQAQQGGNGMGAGAATTGPAVNSGTGAQPVLGSQMLKEQNDTFNAMPEGVAKPKPRTLAEIEASRPASPGATRGFTEQVLSGGTLNTLGGPISADQVRSTGSTGTVYQGPSGGTYNADGSARGTTGTGLSRQDGGNIGFANEGIMQMAQEYRDRQSDYTQARDRQYAKDIQAFNLQKAQEEARKQYESDIFMGRKDPKLAAEEYKAKLGAVGGAAESAMQSATTERGQDIELQKAQLDANATGQAATAKSAMDAIKEARMAQSDAVDQQYKQARLEQLGQGLALDEAATESLMRSRQAEQLLGLGNLKQRQTEADRKTLGDISSVLGNVNLSRQQQVSLLKSYLGEGSDDIIAQLLPQL